MKNLICSFITLVINGSNYHHIKFGTFRKNFVFANLLLIVCLLAGCSGNNPGPSPNPSNISSAENVNATSTQPSPTATNSPSPAVAASITASPNPVPAGKGFGKTTVTWNTGDGSIGQVYVSVNGEQEKIFADGRPQGSLDAPWIGAGATYEFRLYSGKDHKKLLASVKVIRDK